MFFVLLLILHVLISVALIVIVLAQTSKGDAVGGMLGAAATSTFGGQGASNFLKKWTRYLAIAWMASSVLLAFTVNSTKGVTSSKVQEKVKQEAEQQSDTAPVNLPETQPETQPKASPSTTSDTNIPTKTD